MTNFTHKSFAWTWMLALLVASIGVSVEQVYCYCLGKTSVSLFIADDLCQAAHPSIPITDIQPCCAKKIKENADSCCGKKDRDSRDCTHKTTRYHQLKTAFEVEKTGFKKLVFPDLSAPSVSFLQPFCAIPTSACLLKSYGLEFRPPPISGRMKGVWQGVFRC